MEMPKHVVSGAATLGLAATGILGAYGGYEVGKSEQQAAHIRLTQTEDCRDARLSGADSQPDSEPKFARRVEIPTSCLSLVQTFEAVHWADRRIKASGISTVMKGEIYYRLPPPDQPVAEARKTLGAATQTMAAAMIAGLIMGIGVPAAAGAGISEYMRRRRPQSFQEAMRRIGR